jgi:hypothetical protein
MTSSAQGKTFRLLPTSQPNLLGGRVYPGSHSSIEKTIGNSAKRAEIGPRPSDGSRKPRAGQGRARRHGFITTSDIRMRAETAIEARLVPRVGKTTGDCGRPPRRARVQILTRCSRSTDGMSNAAALLASTCAYPSTGQPYLSPSLLTLRPKLTIHRLKQICNTLSTMHLSRELDKHRDPSSEHDSISATYT